MKSFAGKLVRWLFRLAVKLLIVVCLVAILILVSVFLFPEQIVAVIAPYAAAGFECRAGSIKWLINGVRVYDLHASFGGVTADMERVVCTWHTQGEDFPVFHLHLDDGTVSFSLPEPDIAEIPESPAVPGTNRWWNVCQSPVTAFVQATNITFLVTAPRLGRSFNTAVSLHCSVSSTAILNRVRGTCTGLLSSSEVLSFTLLQKSNRLDIACDAAAVEMPRLAEEIAPYIPLSIYCSRGQAAGSLHAGILFGDGPPVLTNTRLTAVVDGLNATIPRSGINARKFSGDLTLHTTQAIHMHTNHPDLVKYLFESVGGCSTAVMQELTCKNIPVTNIVLHARMISNHVHIVDGTMNIFGGSIHTAGRLARKKVKGKPAWRFRYDIDLTITNIDAGIICDTFNMYENRLEGRFYGSISTYIFSRWVKQLSGVLDSAGNGIFYFPESEKYVQSMDPGMQKQMVTIMTDRLKKYPYQVCHVDLDYDRAEKTTYFTFGFYSEHDNSSYLFPIELHMSWIDALKLLRQFQIR